MEYRTIVLSMKRLLAEGKITLDDVQSRVKSESNPNGIINSAEYEYIIGG